MANNNLLVVLEIDNVLVRLHQLAHIKAPTHFDFVIDGYGVKKRSFLTEFLAAICSHFDVAIWSTLTKAQILQIQEEIWPKHHQPLFIYDCSECCAADLPQPKTDKPSSNLSIYNKDLHKVASFYDLERVIAVDWNPAQYHTQPNKVIPIEAFYEDTRLGRYGKDIALLTLQEKLMCIDKTGDMPASLYGNHAAIGKA